MSDVLSWIRLPGPFLVGHRGFPAAARENTPPSFEAALEAGCDGVELDVRLTRDGIPVVHHDAGATGPDGPVVLDETDWEPLATMRFVDERGAYTVHTLHEVLSALSGRCLVNVELKPPRPERREEMVERVIPEIRRVRPRESILVSSFDPDLLEILGRRDRSLALGFLFTTLAELNHFEQGTAIDGMTALHPRRDLVDARFMKRAAERGLLVTAWTVDDPAEAGRLVRLGVTGIVTNRPDLDFDALYDEPAPR